MTGAESRQLKRGDRVRWGDSLTDRGTVESVDWRGVRIAGDDGHKTEVFHNDMGSVSVVPTNLM
jgi:small-conductance mechanosensitive channel